MLLSSMSVELSALLYNSGLCNGFRIG